MIKPASTSTAGDRIDDRIEAQFDRARLAPQRQPQQRDAVVIRREWQSAHPRRILEHRRCAGGIGARDDERTAARPSARPREGSDSDRADRESRR